VTLASGYDGDGDALPIRTDARIVGASIKAGETAEYQLGKDRRGYLVPATGAVEIEGVRVNARDGAAIRDVETLRVTAIEDSEIVLVDAA
jgi:redox-sensitive bicupin YhaK (pirin superfamily)